MTTPHRRPPETHRLVESRDDLLSVFRGGEKPRRALAIGTEHEKFVYRCADHRAPSYDEPGGIRDLLDGADRVRLEAGRSRTATSSP